MKKYIKKIKILFSNNENSFKKFIINKNFLIF